MTAKAEKIRAGRIIRSFGTTRHTTTKPSSYRPATATMRPFWIAEGLQATAGATAQWVGTDARRYLRSL
jgi:hypothetical protein